MITLGLVKPEYVLALLEPLRERFREKYGLSPAWGCWVEVDESGIPEIIVRIEDDDQILADDIRIVKDAVMEYLDCVPQTQEYLTHVQFQLPDGYEAE